MKLCDWSQTQWLSKCPIFSDSYWGNGDWLLDVYPEKCQRSTSFFSRGKLKRRQVRETSWEEKMRLCASCGCSSWLFLCRGRAPALRTSNCRKLRRARDAALHHLWWRSMAIWVRKIIYNIPFWFFLVMVQYQKNVVKQLYSVTSCLPVDPSRKRPRVWDGPSLAALPPSSGASKDHIGDVYLIMSPTVGEPIRWWNPPNPGSVDIPIHWAPMGFNPIW